MTEQPPAIVLFDGVCNLCNGGVRWLIRHDPHGRLRFASLQSDAGGELVTRHGLEGVQSVVVIANGRAIVRSDAVLFLGHAAGQPWSQLATVAGLVPRPLRDLAYRGVARSRYRVFGRRQECIVPTPELRARFVP